MLFCRKHYAERRHTAIEPGQVLGETLTVDSEAKEVFYCFDSIWLLRNRPPMVCRLLISGLGA